MGIMCGNVVLSQNVKSVHRKRNISEKIYCWFVNSQVIHLFWLHGDFFKRRRGEISGFYVN